VNGPACRLILGDCVDRMKDIEECSIDLILTSPPYDDLRTYAAGSAFDFGATADQCKRVLKPGGVLVWVVGDRTVAGSETGTSFRQALHFKAIGLNLNDTMIYAKWNPWPHNHRGRYEPAFEFMFVFARGRPATWNPLMVPNPGAGRERRSRASADPLRRRDYPGKLHRTRPEGPRKNIWYYDVEKKTYGHPAVFPLPLAVDHILSWTNPGDTVLDPFLGSGTVLEACFHTGRRGIGIDISPDYLAIAERRIAAARAAMPLFAPSEAR
jgi:DNA modification methylase